VDRDVLVDGLTALYWTTTSNTSSQLFAKLWGEPQDSTKVIAVKSVELILATDESLPWYPPLEDMRALNGPAVRAALISLSATILTKPHSQQKSNSELPSSSMIFQLLHLLTLDPRLAFAPTTAYSDDVAHLFSTVASLCFEPSPRKVRETVVPLAAILIDAISSGMVSGSGIQPALTNIGNYL
jgi:hypothetical protein